MTFAAQNLEALESHKAEAATLRKRLQEHHAQFTCEPMGGQSMGPGVKSACQESASRHEQAMDCISNHVWFFSNSREDSSKSKGAGPEESGKLSQSIHPASRGVAAHTAGLFRSVRGAKGGFPPWGLPKLRIFTFPPRGGSPS